MKNRRLNSIPLNIILSASFFSFLVSCSDVELNPEQTDRYISFGTPGLEFEGTRASLVDGFGTEEGKVSEFRVWGYCVPNRVGTNEDDPASASADWDTKSGHVKPDVFNGMTVGYSNGNMTYLPSKEWLTHGSDVSASYEYKYGFIAVANDNGSGFTMNSGPGVPELSFTMPFQKTDDYNTALDRKAVPDALLASRFDQTRRMGKVNLNFEHILTGIRFRAVNSSGQLLTVRKVTLSGRFYRSGRFRFQTTKMTRSVESLESDYYSGTFTIFDGTQDIPDNQSQIIGKDLSNDNDLGNVLLLLPNPNGVPPVGEDLDPAVFSLGSNKVITIEYTLTDVSGNAVNYSGSTGKFSLRYVPQPNTLHTANLTFTGDRVIVLFEADNNTNWENGSDNNIEIN